MAQAIPIILMAVSAAISVKSYQDQKKAAKTAEQIGMMNAAATEAEVAEEARRLKDNQLRVLAETKAMGAASGIAGGSHDIYTTEMERTQETELEWLKKSGKSRAEIERMQGRHARQQGEAGAMGALSSAVSKAGKTYSYGKAWYDA